jgi:hypothetical protein
VVYYAVIPLPRLTAIKEFDMKNQNKERAFALLAIVLVFTLMVQNDPL